MNQNEKLGSWGAISLIVTLVITKALISAPSFYAKQSASAGWLEVLICGLFELFILSVVLKLALSFENRDLIDIADYAFGKIGKILVGTFSMVTFLISAAAVFRSFAELIRNTIIRGISYENIALFLFAAGIVAAYLGIRTQVSLNGIILPFVLTGILVIALINTSRYSVTNIMPFLGTGLKNVAFNAILKNATYYEVGITLFLLPYFKEKSLVKKISFTALSLSILLSSLIALLYQLSVPYEAAGNFAMPLYQMTRMIKAGTFFQRLEPLNIFLCGGAMFIYIGIGIRMSAHIFKKTFSVEHSQPLVFIFAQIVCIMALIPGSETSVEKIYDFLLTYGYVAYPILPLLFLVFATAFSKNKMRCSH